MPRFVVLRHEAPPGYDRPTHWDFMLECGGVLRTWALAEPPSPGRAIAAEELSDHRLAYLDYEGEVSGGRGSVTRWDAGTYEVLCGRLAPGDEAPHAVQPAVPIGQTGMPAPQPPLTPALSPEGERETGALRLVMRGDKLSGEVALTPVRLPPDQGACAPRSPEGPEISAASSPRYWSFIWKGT